MSKFIVEKSMPLKGEIYIDGAKNSALPIIAASLLLSGTSIIKNVPKLTDIDVMCRLLEIVGAKIKRNYTEKSIEICAENLTQNELPIDYVQKIRASFLLAGPFLARNKKIKIQMPGGCPIGVRPIDLHLKGFASMGAKIVQEHGVIEISCNNLKGAEIHLDFPSVGATENIIMAACFAQGETIITNCAVEPEIVDLIDFLVKSGCKISGAGTDTIKVIGVDCAYGCTHKIIPDRIEAGTFLAATVATRGNLTLKNICCEHLKAVTSKLREMNVEIIEKENSLMLNANVDIKTSEIKTMPYPGFPTDLQPQFMGLFTSINGTGIINETIFENRFLHVGELNRMGADIKLKGNCAIINGVKKMTGAEVKATDLRAGAALIIAALCADGTSEISDISNIERGYYNIEEKLQKIGANIKRI